MRSKSSSGVVGFISGCYNFVKECFEMAGGIIAGENGSPKMIIFQNREFISIFEEMAR